MLVTLERAEYYLLVFSLVVLLTPDGVRSQQVRWEIEYALGSPAFKNRLIPIIVGSPDKIQRDGIF